MSAGEGAALLAVAAFPFAVLFLAGGTFWLGIQMHWWR